MQQPMPPIARPNFPDRPVLGMMHKGGTIKKTGLYEMKKGEKVTPTKGKMPGKGKLTAATRAKIPTGQFALPGRRYPIQNPSHARNALARISEYGTPAEKSKVRAAVHRKYPSMGKHKMVSVSALAG
jgi:hypothetical protein